MKSWTNLKRASSLGRVHLLVHTPNWMAVRDQPPTQLSSTALDSALEMV